MKTLYAIIFLILTQSLAVNAQFVDNFSDGNFTSNPTWSGDIAKFQVNSIGQLQTNGPVAADSAILFTPSSVMDNIEWSFFVRMSFAPSNNNFARIYLCADNSNLGGSLNGYFIKIGENGSLDPVELYKQTGNQTNLLIRGVEGIAAKSNNLLKIKVLRDLTGNWELFVDSLGGNNLIAQGTAFDNSHTTTNTFGLFCKYTSSNSNRFYFDDFYVGPEQVDTIPPSLVSATLITLNTLRLTFSEPVNVSQALNVNNFSVNVLVGSPLSIQQVAGSTEVFDLTFVNNFMAGINYQLTVSNISDVVGNTLQSANIGFSYFQAGVKDVQISELLPDPSPALGLPEQEFVEIYNHTNSSINLNRWILGKASSETRLPNIDLAAGEYLILCPTSSVAAFQAFGRTVGLSPWPALTNSGETIFLNDSSRNFIDAVSYDLSFYRDNFKADGGWSLEKIDFTNNCNGALNWNASINLNGGTPGAVNSRNGVVVDTAAMRVSNLGISPTSDTLLVDFNKELGSNQLSSLNFQLSPNIPIIGFSIVEPRRQQVRLILANPLQVGLLYNLKVVDVSSCNGIVNTPFETILGVPEDPIEGEVLINEILFNPVTGGVDFVEIYNYSNKVFDFNNLYLANTDEENNIDQFERLSDVPALMLPRKYYVFTANAANIRSQYTVPDSANLIQLSGLPTYPDDEGTCVILDKFNNRLQSFSYNEEMHSKLLARKDGVSLERLSFTVPIDKASSWFSASAQAGYATPGYLNSQTSSGQIISGNITLSPDVITPNGDGFNDFLQISYQFDKPGFIANVWVFDSMGRMLRKISENELLAQDGTLIWDVSNQNIQLTGSGNHLILFEALHPDGETFSKRIAFAIFRN